MAVLGNGMLLPWMLAHLEHEGIRWIMEQDVLSQGPPDRSGRPYFLDLRRKPLLVYGKPAFQPAGVDDLITVPPPEELPAGLDRNETAMDLIVKKLCRSGQTVCDPMMLDRAGTALGARRQGCTFIGATEHQSCSGPHPEADDGSRSRLRWIIRNRFTQRRRNERVAAHANPVGDTGSSFRRR